MIEDEQASIDSTLDSSTGFTEEMTDDSEEKGDDVVNETTGQETKEIDAYDEPIEQVLLASQISVSYETDYIHETYDPIYRENEEGVTFTIFTGNEVNDIDELVFYYDTSLLNHTVREFDNEGGNTTIIVYVTGLKECNTDFIITTEYELENRGEDAKGYIYNIHRADCSEGKTVYVTETGEKYHYSAACAGENAIKTIRFDAEMWGFGPCGKCVN